mmetsp:Transcript_2263/g.5253  ORF Transcript_2263/g.5253 Transcript_2263/m.5253 type:complete len:407 (+) Transcript_2263:114-1334(+)
MENEENVNTQRDECDSMAVIFSDDFTLLGQNPLSYSIRLRPDSSTAAERREVETIEDSSSLWAAPDDLALSVTYHAAYPDTMPIFGLVNKNTNEKHASLHAIQEQALLKAITTAALAEAGMPCVYGCTHAACAFLENGGLAQAGISLLSDDCLAHILSYLASSRDDVEEVCTALPIFEVASKTNTVWRELCRRRWGEKWRFKKRWKCALDKFLTQSGQHFWMKAYEDEEEDAKRNHIICQELSEMAFDYRQWFSFTLFRNQPDNMRDVLPTGLRNSLAQDVVFSDNGDVQTSREWLRRLSWKSVNSNNDGTLSEIRLWFESNVRRVVGESLTVHRLKNWGWELRGSDYVMRAIDDSHSSEEELWGDLTSKIVLEEKPDWVEAHRSPYPYQYREIPDDEDYKILLDW